MSVSAATFLSFQEGRQLYVEHVAMAPETDHEVTQWEWDVVNRWSSDPIRGGTEPSLGFSARRLVREAWTAYNWGLAYTPAIFKKLPTLQPSTMDQAEAENVVDASLQQTEIYMREAIERSHALATLLLRHAAVLEQLGDRKISLAKEEYERALQYFSDPGHQAFIAWKIGDLSSRLGHDEDAFIWWTKASQIAQGPGQPAGTTSSALSIPQSPLAQRILSSIFVSESALLARSGKLTEARAIEETALNFLRSIRPPESFASASAPQALHALYLLQRSSLLSIHLAEVLHAQHHPEFSSIQYLTSAAESSERVARLLTGSQIQKSSDSDTENQSTPAINIQELLPMYTRSRSMNTPANALLRDARRTAAEAWHLLGILYEDREGTKSPKALGCFERAINWAGTVTPDGQGLQAADDILESDWHIYWKIISALRTHR
ncbi:hypothetical protein BDZ97DRAFT_2005506 [Flammula alnicola]|nr:hypothetical protein BDZ97DRAFT_2005506 [Flammula alnicola]